MKEKVPMMMNTLRGLERDLKRALTPIEGKISEQRQQEARHTQEEINKIQTKHQKSRRLYAKATHQVEGDTASKYWTNLTKDPKPRDIMYTVYDPGEPSKQAKRSDEMAELARDYHERAQNKDYSPLTGGRLTSAMEVLEEVDARHAPQDPGNLGQRINRTEVEMALQKSANGKAAGMDGIPYEIWKRIQKSHDEHAKGGRTFPDIIEILTKIYNDVEEFGTDPEAQFSIGWLCPIYKKGDRHNIANYRPITLLNADYKIMTKALAMKLASAVPGLIHKNQAGFIPGRSIFDQTQLAHLMIDYAEATEENGVIVALDQEKAYDRIDHEYMWLTLEKFEIPKQTIRTIQALYEHAETSAVINGVISSPFRVTRGVRQGDPMSCLLFDLAIEPLACMIRKSNLQGFRIPGEQERLITTLFADDTTVYLSEYDCYEDLELILTKWCTASLAKFNLDKTQILPIGTKTYRTQYLLDGAPLDQRDKTVPDSKAIRILGAWIGNETDEAAIWTPKIDKIKK